jgi:hypothetical protein
MAQLRDLCLQHLPQPDALVWLLAAADLRAEVSSAHCCAEAFGFDEATRYNDVAISPLEFHWESQSLTREPGSATSTTASAAARCCCLCGRRTGPAG